MDRAKARVKTLSQDKSVGTIEMTPEDFGADVTVGDAASLFAEMTINGALTPTNQKHPILNLSPLPQGAIDRIRDEKNIDLQGYRQIMTTAKVKHAYSNHGPSEPDKDQKPITFSDYGVASAIISDFSDIEVLPKSGSKPLRIQLIKKMPNGILHVIEAIGGKRGSANILEYVEEEKIRRDPRNRCPLSRPPIQRPKHVSDPKHSIPLFVLFTSRTTFACLMVPGPPEAIHRYPGRLRGGEFGFAGATVHGTSRH